MKTRSCIILYGFSAFTFIAVVVISLQMAPRHPSVRERMKSESFNRMYADAVPPRDFDLWRKKYGQGEPDLSTPEGRAIIERDHARLPEAMDAFMKMVSALPDVYVSDNGAAEDSFIDDVRRLLGSFTRESRAKLLSSIKWGACGKSLENVLGRMNSDEIRSAAVEKYYRVACKLADMLWTEAGMEYEAAEADYKIFVSLQARRRFSQQKGLKEVDEALMRCIDEWKRCRCDSEQSNFCRSHLYWEDRYHRYYEERVNRGETHWLTFLSDRYRFHLSVARDILGRNPKWGP